MSKLKLLKNGTEAGQVVQLVSDGGRPITDEGILVGIEPCRISFKVPGKSSMSPMSGGMPAAFHLSDGTKSVEIMVERVQLVQGGISVAALIKPSAPW